MISPEERALCTEAVQSAFSHLETRDVPALLRDLAALKNVFVYSDYQFWKQWEEAKPRIVRLLFGALPFEEFLNCYEGRNFYGFGIWKYLDEFDGEIPVAQLQILCEKFHFPHPRTAPRSVERLVNAPEAQFTIWLSVWVDGYFESYRDGILRDYWSPSHNFADALLILARRGDALEIVAPMLREKRFGEALNSANRALLEGLGARDDQTARQFLLELARTNQTTDFRLLLLAKIAAFAPQQSLGFAILRLQQAREAIDIEKHLCWLDKNALPLETAARQVEPQIDTRRWSAVSRATLSEVWARQYPFWPLTTSQQTRLILRVARHLHRLRELELGCAPLLLGFPILGASWLYLLNWTLGSPPYSLRWVERLPGLAWTDLVLLVIVWPLFTGGQIWQGTHGMESVRENWESALFFYGATLAFLLGTALVRFAPLIQLFQGI